MKAKERLRKFFMDNKPFMSWMTNEEYKELISIFNQLEKETREQEQEYIEGQYHDEEQ